MKIDPQTSPPSWATAQISMVTSAKKTETRSLTVANILDAIRAGKWAREVKAIAAAYAKALETAQLEGKADPVAVAKEAVREDKLKLPGVMFSGTFSRRASDALETHSGLLCLDMDNCAAPAELRAKIAADEHVQAAFISPTGSGLKVLVRVKADASLHADSFAAAKKHFGETYGVSIDESGKDVSRLCFSSHDPNIFIREEDAEILESLPQSEQQEQPPQPKSEPEAETYESLPRPCYRVYHDCWRKGDKWMPPGTWFHDHHITKKGEAVETDHRLCDPLEVLGKTSVRGDIEHGRLVEFTSSTGIPKRHVLPMRFFAGRGDEALGVLLSLGLETERDNQGEILRYIQQEKTEVFYKMALTTGWFDQHTFVMPDGPIGAEGYSGNVVYQGVDTENPYSAGGTLEQWQSKVAALAAGNPNVILTICAGLAGPLLYLLNLNGAILHLYGVSSTGKTSTLEAGASCWGGGEADNKKNSSETGWRPRSDSKLPRRSTPTPSLSSTKSITSMPKRLTK